MRRSACQRCRAKKLKCDGSKPCAACQKAGVECIAHTIRLRTTNYPLRPTESRGDSSTLPPAILEETNVIELGKRLFQQDYESVFTEYPSAIPGSHACLPRVEQVYSWRESITFPLLDVSVLDQLVQHYFTSVNWFMHVIDERSFHRMVGEHLSATNVPESRRNFTTLLVLVWALGAHYIWTDPSAPFDRDALALFRSKALDYVDSKYLSLLSRPNLETVQVGILLGSFHMFNGQPNLGFGILGGTIKSAQLIGLHRGFPRSSSNERASNEYAKVWWALEIYEKYCAIAFGRPCGIDDSDCDVPEIDDEAAGGVTDLKYHKTKCRLYRIIGPFLGRRKGVDQSKSAHEIHEKLRTWFANIPGELRISEAGSANANSIVQMQAMALQLAYDNIQIVLHRQTTFHVRSLPTQDWNNAASMEQLLESALRTAQVSTNAAVVPICRSSHAAMHVAICLFTAGVLLAALHLEHSASHEGKELLPALENVILFFRNFPGNDYALATQSLNILEALHRKCTAQYPENSSGQDTNQLLRATTDVTRHELAESFLESMAWPTDSLTSSTDVDDFTTTGLLDYLSNSSLHGVAQSYLWLMPEDQFAENQGGDMT